MRMIILFLCQIPCTFIHARLYRVGEDEAVGLEIFIQISRNTGHYRVIRQTFLPAEDHPHAVVCFHIPENDQKIVPIAEMGIGYFSRPFGEQLFDSF